MGVSYAGRVNVTASGRTCQVWSESQPHKHSNTDVGEHNFCRNPGSDPGPPVLQAGVWCYTTDPEKTWEYCSVPRCDATYNCQEGDPPGRSYSGKMNVTTSGRTCQVWATTQPHEHPFTDVGEHNYCRNPYKHPGGVFCFTTDAEKRFELCSVPICGSALKVLDFSADNNDEPDINGEFTSATLLNAVALPESFTICSALMVDAWTTGNAEAVMFVLLDRFGYMWSMVYVHATTSYTEYEVYHAHITLVKQTKVVFFPLRWKRVCLSLDSVAGKLTLVVDGVLLGEEEYMREADMHRPYNLNLYLGYYETKNRYGIGMPSDYKEYPIKVANLNVFNSSLSVERMTGLTRAGEEVCGAAGDILSWEEAEWTLHSHAKLIEVDRELEGPCRRESQVILFPAAFQRHHDCMHHCQKIGGGRSPPVSRKEDWENLVKEIELIACVEFAASQSDAVCMEARRELPSFWLSATEGDQFNKLARLDHWPKTETVKNETKKLEAKETIWRDFYTGQTLDTRVSQKTPFKDFDKRYLVNNF